MCLCVTEEDMTDPSQNTTKNIPVGCLPPVSGGGGDGGGGPLVTKFEQVSIRGYRMPLVEGTRRGPCMVRSHVLGGGGTVEIGPCMVNSNASWVMIPPCGQTNTTENITFPQLCWQVIMSSPGVAFSKAPT